MDLKDPEERTKMKRQIDEQVTELLVETREYGLQHGRFSLNSPFDTTSLPMLMWFDALEAAGCVIVSVTEHSLQPLLADGRPTLKVNILFRMPRVVQ